MALALVTVLLVTWAVVPWLDRRAAREQPSPAFNDLGVAALLFIGFLTLEAWDIGGLRPGQAGLPDAAASARACAFRSPAARPACRCRSNSASRTTATAYPPTCCRTCSIHS